MCVCVMLPKERFFYSSRQDNEGRCGGDEADDDR